MNMDLLCVLAVWFTNVILLVSVIIILYNINKNIKDKKELELLKINFEFEPKDDDFEIIDRLIQENLATYRVLKLENIEKLYITEEIQRKMFGYILRETMYQISPVYMQKLSYLYNKDRLDDIISQKINMAILDYTVEVNSNIRK